MIIIIFIIIIILLSILFIILYNILYKNYNVNINFYQNEIFKTNNYISTMIDRYGTNAIPYISFIYLCDKTNVNLYHNCDENCERFKNNILHKYLVSKTKQTKDDKIIKNDINTNSIIWSGEEICKEIYFKTNKPFPDIFHNSKMFNELRDLYTSKYGKSYIKYKDSTIIHVRLDDVYNNELYDNKDNKLQQFLGEKNLILLINFILKKFKTSIYLMTTPNDRDKQICYNCLNKSNYESDDYYKNILGSDDIDYDLYLMMNCKNLIIGRSTFTFIPAILQKNIVYTYSNWNHYKYIKGGDISSWKIKVLKYK